MKKRKNWFSGGATVFICLHVYNTEKGCLYTTDLKGCVGCRQQYTQFPFKRDAFCFFCNETLFEISMMKQFPKQRIHFY